MDRRLWFALVVLWYAGAVQVYVRAAEFEAATARIDITPAPGEALWGYSNRASAATATLDPLYARVLVLADGQKKVALVALDLGRTFPVQSMESVRERVRKSAGIDTVFFCASHTHSGPVIDDEYPAGRMPPWQSAALEKIGAAVEQAAGRLIPARIGSGSGETYIGHNRRWVGPDGTVKMFWRNPTRVPTSPVDPSVGVIRVDGADGVPIAVLVHYACHPVVFGPDNLRYSADFPGAMARTVEAAFDNRPICFFLQGAPGDINPFMDKTPLAENADKVMVEVGEQLGREAARVARSIRTAAPSNPSLKASLETLQFRPRWDLEKMRASVTKAYGEEAAKRLLARYSQAIQAPVMTFLINDQIALVGVPGEPFVDLQIDLRSRSPLRSTFLVGYSNGYTAYYPTIRAAVEGGYGANNITTVVEVGAGETIVDHGIIAIYKMLGMLKATPTQ